jgi:Rps23 Pro-64 3,4-dihydroxylase Tpa1-like proline 4-hydroxylase
MLSCPLDLHRLRAEFRSAKPVPYVKIDNFLDDQAARRIVAAYPSLDLAGTQGTTFAAVNERKKIQICDSNKFASPVAALSDFLASPKFLADLSYITCMPNVLADPELLGGGIHLTGPGGHLDVHIDFNYIEDRKLHRRLNLLLYLNETWDPSWGGQFQLWNEDVTKCEATFDPVFNRCVIFETSEISFHGVVPIANSAKHPRRSFATYYYTREAPAHWAGNVHSTVFKARPDEKIKAYVLMPAERAKRASEAGLDRLKRSVKALLCR